MLIASLRFFCFFLLVLSGYYLLPHKRRWIWLLLTSYIFYMSWSIKYAIILLVMTGISYSVARQIAAKDNQDAKRRTLQIGLLFSFAVLGLFKYTNFFLSPVNELLSFLGVHDTIPRLSIFFPIGLSFFTLQMISYIIDVYNETTDIETHFGKYALYVAFFPQLIMGPIERAGHLLPELTRRITFDYQNFVGGLIRIGWGFWKKLVIADRLAVVTDAAFGRPGIFSGGEMAVAVLLYALQIYVDFSAYCDIVIGMAQALGINLTENFDNPYFATSPINFWRRWHITLSNWLRDYIFHPLNFAARRHLTPWIQTRNIMLVFLFSGLWHGASWTFIIWGGLHGAYQAVELALQRRAKARKIRKNPTVWKTAFSIVMTFSLVTFAWIFFRAESVGDAFYIIKSIFTLKPGSSDAVLWEFSTPFEKQVIITVMILLVLIEAAQYFSKMPVWEFIRVSPLLVRWTLCFILIYSVILLGYYGETDPTAFIYSGF